MASRTADFTWLLSKMATMRPVIIDGIRFIVGRIGIDVHAMHAVTLEIMIRTGWAINWDFMEVGSTQTTDLGIGIGEQAALQQGIVSKIDARDDVSGMKRHLLIFGEKIVRIAV